MEGELIPGLPDDIAMECLLRVPQRFHSIIKCVCRRWHSLLSLPYFYRLRLASATAEHLICLVQAISTPHPSNYYSTITSSKPNHHRESEEGGTVEKPTRTPPVFGVTIYNATHHIWHRLAITPGIPMFAQLLALTSGKIILLGGWDPTTLESVADVYILDLICGGSWKRGAPMSVARSFFACDVVGSSTVYVAGGHDNNKNALRSAEMYDVDADRWTTLPPMLEERDECHSLSSINCFWVVSGYGTDAQGQFRSDAEFYDPATGSWSTRDGVWPFPNNSPRSSIFCGGQRWFIGGQQQQQQQEETSDQEMLVRSIQGVEGLRIGTSPCMTKVGDNQIFVVGSVGGVALLLEVDVSTKPKWKLLQTPQFSGFTFSASCLLI